MSILIQEILPELILAIVACGLFLMGTSSRVMTRMPKPKWRNS